MAANVIFTNSHNTSHATIKTTPIAHNTPMHTPGRFDDSGALVACSLIGEQMAERFTPVPGPLMQAGQVEMRVSELGVELEGLVVYLQRLGFPSRVLHQHS